MQLFWGTGPATLNGTTVTGNTWIGGGGAGNAGIGRPRNQRGHSELGVTSANTISNSDVNLYLGEVAAFGLADSCGYVDRLQQQRLRRDL